MKWIACLLLILPLYSNAEKVTYDVEITVKKGKKTKKSGTIVS